MLHTSEEDTEFGAESELAELRMTKELLSRKVVELTEKLQAKNVDAELRALEEDLKEAQSKAQNAHSLARAEVRSSFLAFPFGFINATQEPC